MPRSAVPRHGRGPRDAQQAAAKADAAVQFFCSEQERYARLVQKANIKLD